MLPGGVLRELFFCSIELPAESKEDRPTCDYETDMYYMYGSCGGAIWSRVVWCQ